MPEFIPRRPVGTSPKARFDQAVWDKLWGSGRLVSNPGATVERTSRGVKIIPRVTRGGGPSAPDGVSLVQCQITTLSEEDYVGVKEWDGSDQIGDEFFVAKSLPGRMPASETIDAVEFDYTYEDDNHRTSDDGDTTEAQVMFPRFVVGAVVYVAETDYSGVEKDSSDLKRIEVNTAREWVKYYEE